MSDDTIFSEINEELRRDRVRSGWRRYGVYVIGAAVLLVVGVAGYEGWNWWRTSSAMHSSDQLFAALKLSDDGKIADAQTALKKLAASGSGDYPTLAKFKQAALLAREGKTAEAQAAYDALATAQGDPQMRSLALLYAANLLVDKGDVAGVKSRVEGLLAPNNPLRGAAEEAIGLAQYKSGDLAGARASFTNVLNDQAASQQTRQRVEIYLAQLTAQGAGATAEPAAKPGAAPAANSPAAPVAKSSAAPAAATAPAAPAAEKPAPAASTEPAGVESNQPMLPDAALQLATPAPQAAPAAPADAAAPTLSTGAGLPTAPDSSTAPAPTPAAGATTQPSGTATPSDTDSVPAGTTPAAPPADPATSSPADAPASGAPASN
jgi:hypothetical protein